MAIDVREATAEDWPAIWRVMQPIIEAGETYALPIDMSEDAAQRYWMTGEGRRVAVAEVDGEVVGTSAGYANRPGNGSHVASGSFMVDSARSGKGVGRVLAEDLIAWARDSGYRAIQFNAVVETNKRAVALWKSLGFEIVGTAPRAFDHPTAGLVALHIMYLEL